MNGGAFGQRLRDHDTLRDLGRPHRRSAEHPHEKLVLTLRLVRNRRHAIHDYAGDVKSVVVLLPYVVDEVAHTRDTTRRERRRFDNDQCKVRGSKRVGGQLSERRGAVDQNELVFIGHTGEGTRQTASEFLAALIDLALQQVAAAGQDIDQLTPSGTHDALRCDPVTIGGDGLRRPEHHAFRLDPECPGGVRLRVGVNHKDPVTCCHGRRRESENHRGLTHPALLVHDRDDSPHGTHRCIPRVPRNSEVDGGPRVRRLGRPAWRPSTGLASNDQLAPRRIRDPRRNNSAAVVAYRSAADTLGPVTSSSPTTATPPRFAVPTDAAPDLALGAFTPYGPWIIEPAALTWNVGLSGVRERTRAQVPELTTPGLLPPGARVLRTGRVLGTALLLWKLKEKPAGGEVSRAGLSKRLRKAFERLGPTYIKMGQIISSGEGIFPPELVREFRLLRDRVPPEPFETVRKTVEADLGAPLESVFSSFERTPIAAASIAQVHAARLRTGEDVVVKVQRPSVADNVRRDLKAMSWFAPHLIGRIPIAALANPPALVELFAETIVEELDFRLEAENMLDIARVLALTEQRQMVVPRPHPTLVTKRVLVMERLAGFAFDDVEGMRAAGIDTEAVVKAGMVAFLEGAMLYGVFHGDLHGGNLFVLPDGRTALLDHGITGRLDEGKRQAFLKLMLAGTTSDIRLQVQALCELGALPADTDVDAVIRDLKLDGPVKDPTKMSPDELIGEIRDITKALLGYGARMPKELMLYVKDLLFLDGAMATLAPNLDLFATLTEIAMYFATQHGQRIADDVGIDLNAAGIDITSIKASMGVEAHVEGLTYAQLQDRRALISKRMDGRQADTAKALGIGSARRRFRRR